MSRILIVTEQLNSPVIISHIESIRNLKHEVTVATSKNQKEFAVNHVETLYFFQKWNFTEWLKFLPVFFATRPQLIHFLIETEKKLSAQNWLLETCQAMGIPIFTHFLNLTYINQKSKNLSFFVYKSDLITCAHRQSLLDLRGFNTLNKKQIRGLIPPVLQMKPNKELSTSESISYFLDKVEKPLIFPFKKELFNYDALPWKIILKALDYKSVLFIGPVDEISKAEKKKIDFMLAEHCQKPKTQWIYNSQNSFAGFLRQLPENSFVFIAGLPLSIQEVSEIFEQAILGKHMLIIDEFQAELYSGLWHHKSNCFILSNYQIIKDLDHLLRHNQLKYFNFKSINTETIKLEIMDAPINEFNRLLNKVLSINYEKRQ